MALAALFIERLTAELAERLTGGKIEKVNMPSKSEAVFTVKTCEGRLDLYLGGTRLCITGRDYERPAKIEKIYQPGGDRVVIFSLAAPGMFGEGEKRELICELFGRNANLILTDGEGIITDCLYRVGAVTESRAVLPGMVYRLPENPGRPPEVSLKGALQSSARSSCKPRNGSITASAAIS